MSLKTPLERLKELRAEIGTSQFDSAVKTLMRERVNAGREKRQRFPRSMYQKLFDAQGGDCPVCDKRLDIPATRNEIDHIDPNREDFNHRSNLQLLHRGCNRSKSSQSVYEQSKRRGKSFTDIISPFQDEAI